MDEKDYNPNKRCMENTFVLKRTNAIKKEGNFKMKRQDKEQHTEMTQFLNF